MKKLFKEVWKSFSKSKIVLFGLTFLVFLTSGILTLIFDVVKTYNTEFNNYKRVSKLQDLTLNSNIKSTGIKPKNIYVTNEAPSIWTFEDETNLQFNSIFVNTDKKFYNLKDLNYGVDNEYVSTNDLSYLLNSNSNLNNIPNSDSDFIFKPNNNQNNELRLYDENGNEIILSISKIENINKWNNGKWEKTTKVSDLYDTKRNNKGEFESLLIDSFNPNNTYIESDFLKKDRSLTKNEIYNAYLKNPSRFYRINPEQVGSYFSFVKNEENDYIFDYSLSNWIINESKPQKDDLTNKITVLDILDKTIINTFDINLNNAIGFDQVRVHKTKILDSNLTIPKNWFVFSKETIEFKRNSFNLSGVDSNNNIDHNVWTGMYFDYLNSLKNSEINSIKTTSNWEKQVINQLVDSKGNIVKSLDKFESQLTKEDLKKPITNSNKETTTIWEMEKLGNEIPTDEIALKLNLNKISSLENKIEVESKKLSNESILEEINDLVNNFGLREYITINSNENKKTEVFQFINIGDENGLMDWNGMKFEQKVGKLVKPIDNTYINSSSIDSNINKHILPVNQVPKILEKLLTGLSVDRNYINPMISFQNIEYFDENKNLVNQPNSKIIWLTPNSSNSRSDLLGLSIIKKSIKEKKQNNLNYIFLKEKNIDQTDWKEFIRFNTFEEMSEYVLSNNLNFAPFDYNNKNLDVLTDKGWIKENANYSNLLSVPFQYLLPSSDIIDQFNNEGNFLLFKNELIKKLTQEVKPIINPNNWIILMNAVDTAFSNYGFGQGLTPPAALSNSVIEKLVIGTLRDASISTNQNFLNMFFVDILSGIKKQMLEFGANNIDKQKEYLMIQIKNISFILKVTTGINLDSAFIDKYLIEPVKFFDSLINMVNSINLDKMIIQLFDEIYNSPRKSNQIIGTGDYLPLIYINITNDVLFSNGLTNLIKSIDLSKLLNDLISNSSTNLPIPENFISSVSFQSIFIKSSSIGQTSLIQNTKWVKDEKYNVVYKSISPKDVLNLFSAKIKFFIPITIDNLGTKLESFLPKTFDIPYDPDYMNPLELDMDLLWFLNKFVFMDNEKVFSLNLFKIFNDATNSIAQVKNDDNQITLERNLSKIALVNESYLKANNKEVYYSNNLEEDLEDISKIDDKFKIKVSNIEYVITGTNMTVDYMHPVINAENIQVNTKNQAIVYVNKYGFDRARRSNANSPMESYFLLSDPKNNLTTSQVQTKLNQFVYSKITGGGKISEENANLNSNIYKKAYLSTEQSLLNPERALRVTSINSLLLALNNIQKYVGILLFVITGIVVSFVVRRYINSRIKVIGILKAQGYSNMKIALSICLLSFIISLFGGLLGYLAGHFAQFGIFKLLSLFWTIPISIVPFNWFTFIFMFFAPFILLTTLTILLTLWFLRKNSISLLNNSLEISDTQFSRKIKNLTKNTSVKNKFSVSLALNSVGKLIALFISISITATVTLFSISTYKVFNNSLDKTYSNRNFTYKTDFITPTIEGGNYAKVKINQPIDIAQKSFNNEFLVDNMLYVPIGIPEEGYIYLNNYFKPGYNPILNKKIEINGEYVNSNGDLDLNDTITPHIFTKSSIDLTVKAGGLSINVWDNLYNSIPESQRTSIINASQDAAKWLKWTQEGKKVILENPETHQQNEYITRFMNFNTPNEYMTLYDETNKTNLQIKNEATGKYEDIRYNYFDYKIDEKLPENSHFEYLSNKKMFSNIKYSSSVLILNGESNANEIRKEYRDFLVQGYDQMFIFNKNNKLSRLPFKRSPMPEFVIDYFIMPGAMGIGNDLDGNVDETFTYINGDILNQSGQSNKKIYGYEKDSKYVKVVDSSGNNLLEKIYSDNDDIYYPLIINEVVKQKHGINIGDKIGFKVNNSYLRNQNLLDSKINDNAKELGTAITFKVIGISNTYINEEWITTKKHANKILNLPDNSFNGIFTNSEHPIQLSNSLALYSNSGYWSGKESIENLDPANLSLVEKEENLKIYKELFYKLENGQNISLVARNIELLYKYKYPQQKISNEEINEKIKKLLSISDLDLKDAEKDAATVINAIKEFVDIYGNKVLESSFVNTISSGIEKEFVLNASNTISDGMVIIMSISFAISLTILIIITTMLINENERNIAIFGILGYTTKEKIRMLFSIYIPIVLISILLSILLTWLIIPVFTSSILATSSVALSVHLTFVNILISSSIVIGIFSITCILAWIVQGRIKPIVLLKGA